LCKTQAEQEEREQSKGTQEAEYREALQQALTHTRRLERELHEKQVAYEQLQQTVPLSHRVSLRDGKASKRAKEPEYIEEAELHDIDRAIAESIQDQEWQQVRRQRRSPQYVVGGSSGLAGAGTAQATGASKSGQSHEPRSHASSNGPAPDFPSQQSDHTFRDEPTARENVTQNPLHGPSQGIHPRMELG
jgi:hypothetical protein